MIPAERDGKNGRGILCRAGNTGQRIAHTCRHRGPFRSKFYRLHPPPSNLSCDSGANEVLDGIRRVSDALKEGKLRISPACRDTIREFGLYRWDIRAAKDAPRKEHDHAMDDIRYFVTTILCREEEGFYALATERR